MLDPLSQHIADLEAAWTVSDPLAPPVSGGVPLHGAARPPSGGPGAPVRGILARTTSGRIILANPAHAAAVEASGRAWRPHALSRLT